MVIFHCYVSSPEGTYRVFLAGGATGLWQPCRSAIFRYSWLDRCDSWCLFHHPKITIKKIQNFHHPFSPPKHLDLNLLSLEKTQKDPKRSKLIDMSIIFRSIPARYSPSTGSMMSMTRHEKRPCPDRCCSAQRSCDKTPGTGQDRWGHMALEGRELQRKHETTLGSDEYLLPEDTCEDRPCWRSKVG